MQISLGLVYDKDGGVASGGNVERMRLVESLHEESPGKTIVFTPLTASCAELKTFLDAAGFVVGVVNGKVSPGKRTKIFREFQDTPVGQGYDFLVAHPGVAAHGLTLTAADQIIWYGPVHSLEQYEQANARIARPGQVRDMRITQIAQMPVEHRAYDVLEGRQVKQNSFLSMFCEEIKKYAPPE